MVVGTGAEAGGAPAGLEESFGGAILGTFKAGGTNDPLVASPPPPSVFAVELVDVEGGTGGTGG